MRATAVRLCGPPSIAASVSKTYASGGIIAVRAPALGRPMLGRPDDVLAMRGVGTGASATQCRSRGGVSIILFWCAQGTPARGAPIAGSTAVGTGVAQVCTLLGELSSTEKRSGRKTEVLYREKK